MRDQTERLSSVALRRNSPPAREQAKNLPRNKRGTPQRRVVEVTRIATEFFRFVQKHERRSVIEK